MTGAELRRIIETAAIFKMSLGRGGEFREEAFTDGVLIFGAEKRLYGAVLGGDPVAIARAGRAVRAPKYPRGGAPDSAVSIWKGSVETFRSLNRGDLVLHWTAKLGHLYWGVVDEEADEPQRRVNDYGQEGLILRRHLVDGWRKASLGGVPLTGLHPKARDLAVNQATLFRVQTHPDYFRALILDESTKEWEDAPDWKSKAKETGWIAKPRAGLFSVQGRRVVPPQIEEAVEHFLEEIKRMTSTALHTAQYANGQTAIVTVKDKKVLFTKEGLQEEVASLLRIQRNKCALTDYDFGRKTANKHLRMSLDRKDSNKHYETGNLQVVTRAANFFKSASDEADWALKARSMEQMAVAIQQKRKASAR